MFQLIIVAALGVLCWGQETTTVANPPQPGTCEGQHEMYLPQGVAPNCDTVCGDIGQPCTRVYVQAPSGCYCLPDHARNDSGVCVPISECKIACLSTDWKLPDLSVIFQKPEKDPESPKPTDAPTKLPAWKPRSGPVLPSLKDLWSRSQDSSPSPNESWAPCRDPLQLPPCLPGLWGQSQHSPSKLARVSLLKNQSPQISPAVPLNLQSLKQGRPAKPVSAVASVSLNPGVQWVNSWTPSQNWWAQPLLAPQNPCPYKYILN